MMIVKKLKRTSQPNILLPLPYKFEGFLLAHYLRNFSIEHQAAVLYARLGKVCYGKDVCTRN